MVLPASQRVSLAPLPRTITAPMATAAMRATSSVYSTSDAPASPVALSVRMTKERSAERRAMDGPFVLGHDGPIDAHPHGGWLLTSIPRTDHFQVARSD